MIPKLGAYAKRMALVAVGVLTALVTLFAFAVFTEPGTSFVVELLRQRLPGNIAIGDVQGTLSTSLRLSDVRLNGDDANVRVGSVVMAIRVLPLIARRLQVDSLEIEDIHVELPQPDTARAMDRPAIMLRDRRLPITIVANQVNANAIAVRHYATKDPIDILDLFMRVNARGDSVSVDTLLVNGSDFTAAASGWLRTSDDYPLHGTLQWTLMSATLPGLAGSGRLDGNLRDLNVAHEIVNPFRLHLVASVRDVVNEPYVDGTIVIEDLETQELDSTFVEATVGATVNVSGVLQQVRSQARVHVNSRHTGQLNAEASVSRRNREWVIDTVVVTTQDRPTSVAASGTVRRVDNRFDFDLTGSWRRLMFPLTSRPIIESQRGEARIVGNREQYVLRVEGDVRTPRTTFGTIEAEARGDTARLLVDRITGRLLDGEMRGRGSVQLDGELRWELLVDAEGMDVTPLVQQEMFNPGPMRGRVETAGSWTVAGPIGQATLDGLSGTVRDVPFSANAAVQYDKTSATIDSLDVTVLGGSVRTLGRVTYTDGIDWDVVMRATDLQPAALFPDSSEWPGQLDFEAVSSGRLADDALTGRAEVHRLTGTLREQQLDVTAQGVFADGVYAIPKFEVDWGQNRIRGVVAVGDSVEGELSVEAPDLGVAWPNASGSLSADATLAGERAAPRIRGSLTGRELALGERRVDEATLRADINLATGGGIELFSRLLGAQWGARRADSLIIIGNGTRSDHRIVVSFIDTAAQVTAAVRGASVDTLWQGQITALDFASDTIGTWKLETPAPLSASPRTAEVEHLCVTSESGRICVEQGRVSSDGWTLNSSLEDVPFALGQSYLPPGVRIDGSVRGSIAGAVGADGAVHGEIELRSGPGTVTYGIGGTTQRLTFDEARMDGRSGPDGLQASAATILEQADGSEFASASARLALPQFTNVRDSIRAQLVQGQVMAYVADLSIVEAFIPELIETAGRLDMEMGIRGTVGRPELLGEAVLTGGRAAVPALGIEIDSIAVTARGNDSGFVDLVGTALLGRGQLRLEGISPTMPTPDSPLRLRLSGQNLHAIATPEVSLWASPDIRIAASPELIEVTGEVRVPKASIELRSAPLQGLNPLSRSALRTGVAVPASRDVIFIDDSAGVGPRRIDLRARTRVVLGDSVSFSGFGFTARPGGSLLITEEPGRTTTGTGQLVLRDGSYRAYGQELTIETGRILFGGGPVDNPGLDVRAFRRARDGVIAGLEITGTLKSPETRVYSEPPMIQSEALAYLILGRPLSEATAADESRLTESAVALGLRGGNLLAERLAAGFKLDEAQIESEGGLETASFVAGKYLSPRLYVSYGVGLLTHISTVRLRYLLSSKWTLQAETGEGTSTDILYRIERGR